MSFFDMLIKEVLAIGAIALWGKVAIDIINHDYDTDDQTEQ